jgi:serine/threonine-protein kinase
MPDLTGRLTTALADRYRIERHLGEGGMATVYLARDVRHDRKVALKVLRPDLSAVIGAERFLNEIKVTANLQHPHILPLHDSGDADGFLYYVMPYVEGETLRAKLDREKQLGIDDAVEIARSVAGALDYAHRKDVIHRDIKPENILMHDGQAMVADFGIALAVSHAGGTRLTETGLSIGTPQYMSPEQALGDRELDARSDVYSLGAMLYEMLAGDPPYTGSTAQAIVAKVITEKAPLVTRHRDKVPPHVAATIAKALSKLPADRFASAAQFADALTNTAFTLPGTAGPAAVGRAREAGAWWTRYAWPAAAALAGLALWGWLRPGPPPSVARYGLQFPVDQEFIDDFHPAFAVAPDGSWIVYVGQSEDGDQLWVKRRDQYRATPLAGSAGARSPVVSHDGAWIAFIAEGELRKVPVGGGSAITLTDSVQTIVPSATWLDDGSIVFTDYQWRLSRVPGIGGPMEVVWADSASRVAILPVGLPDARGVLFTACTPGCNPVQESWVLDLRSGEARMLIPEVAQSWYVATGHLISVRPDGGVFAVPFDLGSLERRGAPVPVLDGIKVDRGVVPDFTLSKSGTLLLAEGTGGGGFLTEAVWVDRLGTVTPVDPDWTFNAVGIAGWALSPDGTRLAIKILGETGDDIWIKQLPRGPVSRLTFDESPDVRPRWTPDGRSVSFRSPRAGDGELYLKRVDGTGPAELVLDLDQPIWEGVWSADGAWLLVGTGGAGASDIVGIRPGVDTVPIPLVASAFDEQAIALSPDGKWLAYGSNETGRDEVYVRPFPNTGDGKWQVSTGGGRSPLWAHSGRELFYLNDTNEMMMADVVTAPSFGVGERRVLFPVGDEDELSTNYTAYDLASDDQRFLMVRVVGADEASRPGAMIVVENWLEELKAKVEQ